MKIEMTKEEYLTLQEFIDINSLDIEIISVVLDEQLYNLGFSKKIPCVVELKATEEVIEEASEIAMGYEINAFNTPDGDYPSSEDEDYILYEKYGRIWDLFNGEHWNYIE